MGLCVTPLKRFFLRMSFELVGGGIPLDPYCTVAAVVEIHCQRCLYTTFKAFLYERQNRLLCAALMGLLTLALLCWASEVQFVGLLLFVVSFTLLMASMHVHLFLFFAFVFLT